MGELPRLRQGGIVRARDEKSASAVPPTAAPLWRRRRRRFLGYGVVSHDFHGHRELWTLLGSEVGVLAANLVSVGTFLVRHVDGARIPDTAQLLLVPIPSDVNDSLRETEI